MFLGLRLRSSLSTGIALRVSAAIMPNGTRMKSANRNALGKRVTTGWHSYESREPSVEFSWFSVTWGSPNADRPTLPHRATAASPYEISARLLVRGPKTPITRITMTIAKAMKEKTPVGPKCSRMKAVR